MRSVKIFAPFAAVSLFSLSAHAETGLNFDFIGNIADAQYKTLIEPVTTPMRYMFSTPAKSTGILGFDLGVAATFIELPKEATNIAKSYISGGDNIPTTMPVPRLTAQKGLPLGFDIGINASIVPGTNIKLLGAGLQYQIDLPIPALPVYAAARGGYTTLLGLDELESTHFNVEGLVSAGMPVGLSAIVDIEPWIGVGADFAKAKSEIKTAANISLNPEHTWTEKYTMAGLRLSLGFLRIGAEAHISMDNKPTMYTAKAAIGF